jgi:hypothetical protein
MSAALSRYCASKPQESMMDVVMVMKREMGTVGEEITVA